jgi:hypothetical protein
MAALHVRVPNVHVWVLAAWGGGRTIERLNARVTVQPAGASSTFTRVVPPDVVKPISRVSPLRSAAGEHEGRNYFEGTTSPPGKKARGDPARQAAGGKDWLGGAKVDFRHYDPHGGKQSRNP